MTRQRPAVAVLTLAMLTATATVFLAPSGLPMGPREAIAKQPDKTPPAKGKPKPTPAPTPRPTPAPTPKPTAKPTPKPTARVTPRPTLRPTPRPAATPRMTARPAVSTRPGGTTATARPRPSAVPSAPPPVRPSPSETAGSSPDVGLAAGASRSEGGSNDAVLVAGAWGVTLLTIGTLGAILVRRRGRPSMVVLTPPHRATIQLAHPMEVVSGDPLLLALEERRGIAEIRTLPHEPSTRPRWVERLEAESAQESIGSKLHLLPAEPSTLENQPDDQPVSGLGA